jgi:hypothetical protein
MKHINIFIKIAEHLNCMYIMGYMYTDLKINNIVYKIVNKDDNDSFKVCDENKIKYYKIKIIDIDSFSPMIKINIKDKTLYYVDKYNYTKNTNEPIEKILGSDSDNIELCPFMTGFGSILYNFLLYFNKHTTETYKDFCNDLQKNNPVFNDILKTI